jgi:hypothetical protein
MWEASHIQSSVQTHSQAGVWHVFKKQCLLLLLLLLQCLLALLAC